MSSSPLCMFLFNSLFLQQIDNIFLALLHTK